MDWHTVDTKTQVIVMGDVVAVLRLKPDGQCRGMITRYEEDCRDVSELIVFTGSGQEEIKKRMETEIASADTFEESHDT